MLTTEARARLTVVLVGARNPQNIGAAARAMQDFGFSDLRVVNEFSPPFEAAQLEAKSAVGASNVMGSARQFDDLPAAIADCTLVIGTTAIGERELSRPIDTLQAIAPQMTAALSTASERVALLFGSEKTGLTNDQLGHCSRLLTIPLYEPEGARHLSMNLGQSVAVSLYELSRAAFQSRPLPAQHEDPATAADRERVAQALLATMQSTGYARRFPANAREHVVRALAQQLGVTRDEAATWLGFFRQVGRSSNEG